MIIFDIRSNSKTNTGSGRDPLANLWNRYIHASYADSQSDFSLSGKEYETVLSRRRFDARAAAIYFDLRCRVLADQLVDTAAPDALTYGEQHLAEVITAGVTYEVACMKYLGEIPDYPDNTLAMADENWSEYEFVRSGDTKALPGYVRAARVEALRIPDYSNVLDMPRPAPLAMAN